MHLLRSYYLHASQGCPEAIPAGIIAIDMPDYIDLSSGASDLSNQVSCLGVFDDAAYQLGYSSEDADLLRGSEDREHFHYLVSNQILPNYQWEILKQSVSFPVVIHSYTELTNDNDDSDTCG